MSDVATVLVVDDDEAVVFATARLLRQAGHLVLEARTGQQGLDLARAQHPDIVLLDVALPDLDGLEVCRRIRAEPTLPDVFVVMVSGSRTSSEQQAEGLRAGADGYIPRPVGNSELLARVDAFLRIRRTELALRQQERLAAVVTLAAGAAHEINNPLMGIIGYAELLQERLDPGSPLHEYADEIVHEAQRVAGIVRSLGGFAEQPSGERRWCAPAAILAEFVTLLRAPLRAEHVRLDLRLPTELPDISCCVPQIRQALLLLVANAREALNEKYPGVHADKVIYLAARARGAGAGAQSELEGQPGAGPPAAPETEELCITIEDHGPGISEAVRGFIFDPFFTTKNRAGHAGLGLTTCRRIVQEHGGTLTVETVPGQWTRAHIALPARRVSDAL